LLTKKSKLDLHVENNYEYLNNVSVLFIYPAKFNAKKNYDFFYFELGFENNGNLTVLDSHDALYFKKDIHFSKFLQIFQTLDQHDFSKYEKCP
jgi:hypothetical protein